MNFKDSMSVDAKTVDRLAELARLEFNDEEKKEIQGDLNRILKLIDKMSEVDTDGVEPLIYMNDEPASLREDIVKQEITQEEALKNAPDKDSDYIRVPKVLDKG
jgi:aspartyl-tRNA(Asn)/glutamyl-tRNA(Gln) amidotransferase subunit C